MGTEPEAILRAVTETLQGLIPVTCLPVEFLTHHELAEHLVSRLSVQGLTLVDRKRWVSLLRYELRAKDPSGRWQR